jgi:hypothetical protein
VNEEPINKGVQMSNSNHIHHTGAALSNPFLAIATAYGDYAKKSFEDTKLYVEKVCGVKSLGNAIEVQAAFVQTSCETFVAGSQRIGVLYGDLAKHSYKPFGGHG